MTTKYSTKRSLIASILILCLCLSSLIGTTFAWFTDSVTSAGNIIKSGKLDVAMYWADGDKAIPADKTGWNDASAGAIFKNDKWEPGYTEAKHIKIANEGTLALKYQLAILPTGEVSKLAEVIDVYYADPAAQVADRTALTDDMKIGTLADVLADMSTMTGELPAGESHTVTLVLKMQESADNDYQELSIGSDFTVRLLATQLAAENDSFGPDYDEDAWVPGMIVYNAADLKAALANGGNVTLAADVDVTEPVEVPEGTSVALNLNGNKITGNVDRTVSNGLIVNNGSLTVYGENSVIDNSVEYGGSVILNSGDLVLNGGTYIGGVSVPAEGKYASYAINVKNGGTLTVNNATIQGRGAIGVTGGATAVINGGLYEATTEGDSAHVVYVSENGNVIINGGTFNHTRQNAGANGDVLVYVNKADASSAVINGGTFDAVKAAIAYGGMNVEITGGTFKNAAAKVYSGTLDSLVANGFKAVLSDGKYVVVPNEISAVVSTASELATAIANGGVVYVATDIDMQNNWASVKPTAELTILGNGKVITNLNLPLLAGGVSTKVTFKGLTVADSDVAPAVVENGLGTGAFVPYVDAYGNVSFEDCHLINTTVTGNERAGGFIGYTSGQTLSFKNCTVDECEITAVGGAGGLVAYSQTKITIDDCSVTNTKVTATEDRLGTKAALAGSVIGTVNADTTISKVTASGNTVSNNNALPAFSNEIGRKVSGVLTIDGKTFVGSAADMSNGGNFVLTGDVQNSSPIKNDTSIDLSGNTYEATGSYDLKDNADFTMTNGDYVVNNTYGHIDVRPDSAEGSVVTFENVNFTSNYKNKTNGTCTDRLVSVVETAPAPNAHIVLVFKNCTFDNAKVYIEGMSGGAGTFEVTFENCTFNALTSSAPIEVKNYMKGTITVKNCTFNLECTSASASAIAVSPSSSTEVTIVAENNTINATAAVASGENGTVEQIKVHGTPANIKFISAYGNTTVTETNTTKTGIAQ